jgi:hypothetical protein
MIKDVIIPESGCLHGARHQYSVVCQRAASRGPGGHGRGRNRRQEVIASLDCVVLGAKDANHWYKGLDAPGLFGNGTNGIGGIFTPKSGDKFLQAFQNRGDAASAACNSDGGRLASVSSSLVNGTFLYALFGISGGTTHLRHVNVQK